MDFLKIFFTKFPKLFLKIQQLNQIHSFFPEYQQFFKEIIKLDFIKK